MLNEGFILIEIGCHKMVIYRRQIQVIYGEDVFQGHVSSLHRERRLEGCEVLLELPHLH